MAIHYALRVNFIKKVLLRPFKSVKRKRCKKRIQARVLFEKTPYGDVKCNSAMEHLTRKFYATEEIAFPESLRVEPVILVSHLSLNNLGHLSPQTTPLFIASSQFESLMNYEILDLYCTVEKYFDSTNFYLEKWSRPSNLSPSVTRPYLLSVTISKWRWIPDNSNRVKSVKHWEVLKELNSCKQYGMFRVKRPKQFKHYPACLVHDKNNDQKQTSAMSPFPLIQLATKNKEFVGSRSSRNSNICVRHVVNKKTSTSGTIPIADVQKKWILLLQFGDYYVEIFIKKSIQFIYGQIVIARQHNFEFGLPIKVTRTTQTDETAKNSNESRKKKCSTRSLLVNKSGKSMDNSEKSQNYIHLMVQNLSRNNGNVQRQSGKSQIAVKCSRLRRGRQTRISMLEIRNKLYSLLTEVSHVVSLQIHAREREWEKF